MTILFTAEGAEAAENPSWAWPSSAFSAFSAVR
jgi:hypothetical protein